MNNANMCSISHNSINTDKCAVLMFDDCLDNTVITAVQYPATWFYLACKVHVCIYVGLIIAQHPWQVKHVALMCYC